MRRRPMGGRRAGVLAEAERRRAVSRRRIHPRRPDAVPGGGAAPAVDGQPGRSRGCSRPDMSSCKRPSAPTSMTCSRAVRSRTSARWSRRWRKTPGIDGHRIAIFNGSGGGSIALELGGNRAVRAVVAGEPATVLYTGGPSPPESMCPRLEIMAAPEKYLTPDLRHRTRWRS